MGRGHRVGSVVMMVLSFYFGRKGSTTHSLRLSNFVEFCFTQLVSLVSYRNKLMCASGVRFEPPTYTYLQEFIGNLPNQQGRGVQR